MRVACPWAAPRQQTQFFRDPCASVVPMLSLFCITPDVKTLWLRGLGALGDDELPQFGQLQFDLVQVGGSLLLYEVGSNGGRESAHESDAGEHQDGGHPLSRASQRHLVPVTDGGYGDYGPPQGIAEAVDCRRSRRMALEVQLESRRREHDGGDRQEYELESVVGSARPGPASVLR